MVIEDIFRSPKSVPTNASDKANASDGATPAPRLMGSPVDRLAALTADLILLIPLISLLTAPFRRQWELARLMHDSDALITSFGGLVCCAMIAVVLYQTAFLSFWGATPGKRILGLRVVSIWTGERPMPLQAFIRSLFWCFEGLLAFIPWFGALSNERRRPWHDRISDTEVIALSPLRAVGAPDPREIMLVSGLNAAMLSIFAAASTMVLMRASRPSTESETAARVSDNGFLCSEVSEAQREWLSVDGEPVSRVEVGLALFGAEAIGQKCLEAEADFALWNGKVNAVAYLAKSMSLEDEFDRHVAYAIKTCETEPSSSACRLAQLLVDTTPPPDEAGKKRAPPAARLRRLTVDDVLKTLGNGSSAYMNVYLVRELVDENRFDDALKLIDKGSPHRRLGYFYASSRSRALWGMHRRDDARVAFRSSLEGLGTSQRADLAKWFCEAESAESCSPEAMMSCNILDRAVKRSPGELESTDMVVAWIRGRECVAGKTVDYKHMLSLVPGAEAQNLIGALERIQKSDREGARKDLQSLLAESEDESPIWYESQTRLVDLADNESELKAIADAWARRDSGDDAWMRLGRRLVTKCESLGLTRRLVDVGSRLMKWDRFDHDLRRKLVVTAYNSGDVTGALKLFANVKTEQHRSPASENEFERVSRELASLPQAAPEKKSMEEKAK